MRYVLNCIIKAVTQSYYLKCNFMKFLLFVQQEELGDTVEENTTDYNTEASSNIWHKVIPLTIIRKQAQIYGTKSDKEITPYQKRINEAATEIALQSPDLLSSRQKLLELARIKVNESGYMYKKGKSHSKQFISDESLSSTPKRLKVGEAMRVKRMAELGDDIKDLNDRVYFKEKRISSVRNKHMVHNLPSSYIFMLVCCFKNDCCNPSFAISCYMVSRWSLCNSYTIPYPIQDPERPWGNDKCPDCSGFCAGHYKLSLIDVSDEAAIKSVLKPPSTYIKEVFNIKKSVTEEDIRLLDN